MPELYRYDYLIPGMANRRYYFYAESEVEADSQLAEFIKKRDIHIGDREEDQPKLLSRSRW